MAGARPQGSLRASAPAAPALRYSLSARSRSLRPLTPVSGHGRGQSASDAGRRFSRREARITSMEENLVRLESPGRSVSGDRGLHDAPGPRRCRPDPRQNYAPRAIRRGARTQSGATSCGSPTCGLNPRIPEWRFTDPRRSGASSSPRSSPTTFLLTGRLAGGEAIHPDEKRRAGARSSLRTHPRPSGPAGQCSTSLLQVKSYPPTIDTSRSKTSP
jgi:hypothetical protein